MFGAVQPAPRRSRLIRCALLHPGGSHFGLPSAPFSPLAAGKTTDGQLRKYSVAQINANTWAISARGFNPESSNELLVMVDGRTVYNRRWRNFNYHKLGCGGYVAPRLFAKEAGRNRSEMWVSDLDAICYS